MKKLITFLKNLGVTSGMTFRCEIEDGVGVLIVPNPTPNRMAVNTVERLPQVREMSNRAPGRWAAKPLHVTW